MDSSDTQSPTRGQGRRLLCIEDEHFIGELYTRALTKAGYQVDVVVDGIKGLEAAMTDSYDIILLDIMVPNMTGIEILRKLRAEKPDLKAKVVVTTNLEQTKEHRKEIEHQADGYIVKAEITPRQLVEFLANIA
ncbi:MAG TPA: response regulator [Candidatus Saccharimonadales bacterium]|nr:response regulator [Candidatus Saccharimonadales bacterium]